MKNIIKFDQFNSSNWIGPVKIIQISNDLIETNFGNFKNNSGTHLTKGYSYLLKIEDDKIVETGMSCVDLIIFKKTGLKYQILSIKRGKDPFKDMWANPGGNIDEGELPIDAAIRELWEETGVNIPKDKLKYIGKFDKDWRDPRNKNCVSYAFMTILDGNYSLDLVAGDDAKECKWIDIDQSGNVPVDMAFDHDEIIKLAWSKVK